MKTVRKRIRFFGDVQGVGFRYRAEHAARLYGVSGFVQNEWDGSVLMEIQGTEEAIDCVLMAIERGRYIRITSMQVKTLPLVSEIGFQITG